MTAKWISKNLLGKGTDKASQPTAAPAQAQQHPEAAIQDKSVVLLLHGKNSFGDRIYSYLKITLSGIDRLREAIQAGQGFNPSDFGTIIAAGKDDPTNEVRAEIASMYQIISQEEEHDKLQPVSVEKKKAWDEY